MEDEVRLDGEGNPLDDEPFVDRVRDQWPLALVMLGMGIGLGIVAFGSFRAGSLVVAASVVFAGFLRAFLPHGTAGMLAVRTRRVDVTTLALLGVSLTVAAVLVPPPPS